MSTERTWQMSLRGLLMGAGTAYRFAAAPEGLGLPPVRTNDLQWLSEDGAYGAGDWLQPRLVRASLWVDGVGAAASEDLATLLTAAWAPSRTDLDLEVRVATGQAYLLRGRPRRCEVDLSTLKFGHAMAAVEFAALDPYKYDPEENTGVVPLGSGVDYPGMTPDLSFDMAFQAPGVSPGVAFVGSLGTAAAWPVLTIVGPVLNPRMENRTTGETFDTDVDLLVGETLVADMKARTITINGTPRLDVLALGADFISLPPGVNELAYRSDDGSPTVSTCTVSWRHTWY